MALQLGDLAPDFSAQTTQGPIQFHTWLGGQWCLFFSHPKDFTPVCTTELGVLARLKPEFDRRQVQIIGVSIDHLDDHHAWKKDIEQIEGVPLAYPLIADPELEVAKLYGMIHENASVTPEKPRTAADNATVRNVFIIDPQKRIRLILVYPMGTGRNFDEILRVIDSLQMGSRHPIATPANWVPGEKVIIVNALSNDDAREKFPQGWKSITPYLRLVEQPEE